MSLSDIKNKLYKKEAEPDMAKREESPYDPISASARLYGTEHDKDLWAEKQLDIAKEHKKKAIKVGAYALGAILGLIAIGLIVFFVNKALFSDTKVTVVISGSAEAKSGELLTYQINYDNNNYMSLKNASMKITFPENFKPEGNESFTQDSLTSGNVNIGNIDAHGKGAIAFSGRMYSPKGALMYLKADLMYSPKSYSSQYISQSQLGINITSSPIVIEIMAPQNVSTGDEVNYVISFKNAGEKDFENIIIRANYPNGFSYASATPRSLEGNNTWYIGHFSSGQEGRITIRGKLEGNKDEAKQVAAYVGIMENGKFVSYNQEEAQTSIVSSSFYISQTVNDQASLSANAGDALVFNISYRNDSNIGLRDVIVTEKIDSPVLDYTTLKLDEKGSFDSSNKIITWKASDYPELANLEPGQGGTIRFSIDVKGVIPVSSANDKNFVISTLAKIDSPDVPTLISGNKIISGNAMDIKLNSKLVLDVKGYYYDNLANSGPIPPKVNEETTYSMHFLVTNVSNGVSNAKVDAVLPTGVTFTGKVYPENTHITYNERTNSITWDIGNIDPGTGVLNPPKEAVFQVKIKPGTDLIGKEANLLNAPTLSATDTFTGQSLSVTGSAKTTNLIEDSQLGSNKNVTQ